VAVAHTGGSGDSDTRRTGSVNSAGDGVSHPVGMDKLGKADQL
jgi:hypothetical protein